ncbi:MFS transporter [Kribbella sancticallisti]|uniref:MFS transporter n=1 Tax=Kribbella sancticallisti TaxID=460087 RepID=A0ABP4Q611_9ACTN
MTIAERTPAKAGRREWIGLAVLALPTLLVSLDTFVMLLALPPVARSLGANSSQQLWIMDIYGFMVAGFMITMGTLGDRIGRRRLLLIGAAVFGVASVLAAYSASAGMLIGTRALLGIAGAAITPCTLSLVMTLFRDRRQQATAIGIWGGCFTVGAVIGPVVGGVLLEHFWWGSVFLIGVPAMVVLLIAGPILLPEYRDKSAGRIDLASVLLSLGAILPAIHGLKDFAAHGVSTVPVLSLLAGLVVGGFFLRRQRRLADPLVDLRLFTRKTFSVTLGSMLCYSMLSGGVMVFTAQYFQLVDGMSPLEAGLALVPGMVTTTISFQLAPLLARWIRPAFLIGGGLFCTVIGMVVLTQADSATTLVVAFAIQCLGAAPLVTLGTNLVVGSAPPEKAGSAAALTQTGNEFGYALGIAVIGSIVTATYRAKVGGDSLASVVEQADRLPGEVVNAARAAFTSGLHTASAIAAAVLTVVAVVLISTLRSVPALSKD